MPDQIKIELEPETCYLHIGKTKEFIELSLITLKK